MQPTCRCQHILSGVCSNHALLVLIVDLDEYLLIVWPVVDDFCLEQESYHRQYLIETPGHSEPTVVLDIVAGRELSIWSCVELGKGIDGAANERRECSTKHGHGTARWATRQIFRDRLCDINGERMVQLSKTLSAPGHTT
jgi:hypothetical protein